MDILTQILPSKIYEIVDRAGICTPKELITLSTWDIKKLTGLKTIDIVLLKNLVAKHSSHPVVLCNKLFDCIEDNKVKSGCASIDKILNGGFHRGVLTEIYGESGSGKTQLAMQISAYNATVGSVYICTEDLFPIKRYNTIHESISKNIQNLGNNMFVEHVYEPLELMSCIRIRLPKLLQQHKISVVVIDSVAAPFRSESLNYIQRAEDLRELAITLIKIARENKVAVVCINQVTANFDDTSHKILPSLGLAWSNMISYRFWIKKSLVDDELSFHNEKPSTREFIIVFAPDLPNAACRFLITSKGVT